MANITRHPTDDEATLKATEIIRVGLALRAVGLLVGELEPGRLIRCKTTYDHGTQKSGWIRLFDDGDILTCIYGDWRQGSYGVWMSGARPETTEGRANVKRLIKQARAECRTERSKQWAGNRVKLLALWNSAETITDRDPAGRYLMNRGLTVPNTDALRFHPCLDYWANGRYIGHYPAMLAAVTSPTKELITVHRTFITPDGHKAPVSIVRKLSPCAGATTGASIKIGTPLPHPNGGLRLGIAEGVETAIAASLLFGLPVWSGVSALTLALFEPPPDVTDVRIFADNDRDGAGQKVAAQLAARLVRRGLSVRIQTPRAAGSDWADELATSVAAV